MDPEAEYESDWTTSEEDNDSSDADYVSDEIREPQSPHPQAMLLQNYSTIPPIRNLE